MSLGFELIYLFKEYLLIMKPVLVAMSSYYFCNVNELNNKNNSTWTTTKKSL